MIIELNRTHAGNQQIVMCEIMLLIYKKELFYLQNYVSQFFL